MTDRKFPHRSYKPGGPEISIVGFGGILVMHAEQDHANRLISKSFERGISYFDVAPGYQDAEIKMGPGLEPYRKKVFLACKTADRSREGAREEFERSLKRLRTDYFDLYQLHGLIHMEQVEEAFGPEGAMELLMEKKKSGQIRYLGFSAHSEEAALAAMERYDFDSILFPLNFATMQKNQFGPAVLKKAREKEMAILALKAVAWQHWPENHPDREQFNKAWYQPIMDEKLRELALRYTLHIPGVTAAVSAGHEEFLDHTLDTAENNLRPLTVEEEETLKQAAMKVESPILP